ncbi:MAG: radical SAM family heme chaperone HemW [Alphaproteobacteria bacterium]|nr:radical SAM family heme chaperone HemW [Alphaproteobacteria bacterium]MDA7989332.1 radical SAM family heme chaperone HemW [Alphaproteobacteria bacterium]
MGAVATAPTMETKTATATVTKKMTETVTETTTTKAAAIASPSPSPSMVMTKTTTTAAAATTASPSQSLSPSRTATTAATTERPPLGIYVHWPFCFSKCPYCDFNSYARTDVPQKLWREALLAELGNAKRLWRPQPLGGVFFGGGTPSLMSPETISGIVSLAFSEWHPAESPEVVLECNPGDITDERLRLWTEAGVNRVSVGVQSFDDGVLRFLGRRHDGADARRAASLTAERFGRFSLDLMYGHRGQEIEMWRRDLSEALSFGGEHLSAYELTLEEGTPFHAEARRGRVLLADEESRLAMRDAADELCGAAGLTRYEVSNYARGGCECRHNLGVWGGGDYVAVGPGAHGRGTRGGERFAVMRERSPGGWLRRTRGDGDGDGDGAGAGDDFRILSWGERRDEAFLFGMRKADGLTRDHLERESGCRDFGEVLGGSGGLERAKCEGWLEEDELGLRATASGFDRLDGLLSRLLSTAPN